MAAPSPLIFETGRKVVGAAALFIRVATPVSCTGLKVKPASRFCLLLSIDSLLFPFSFLHSFHFIYFSETRRWWPFLVGFGRFKRQFCSPSLKAILSHRFDKHRNGSVGRTRTYDRRTPKCTTPSNTHSSLIGSWPCITNI